MPRRAGRTNRACVGVLLVVAVYFLGDISAHFNPATTLAFALRRDMDWVMAGVYWVVQSRPPPADPCWSADGDTG